MFITMKYYVYHNTMLRRGVMAVRGQAETRLKLGAAGAAGLLLFLALVHLKLYLYMSSNLYLFPNLYLSSYLYLYQYLCTK